MTVNIASNGRFPVTPVSHSARAEHRPIRSLDFERLFRRNQGGVTVDKKAAALRTTHKY